ncbi:MAG: PIN domain-containing protein [Pirellulaceae bacterium]
MNTHPHEATKSESGKILLIDLDNCPKDLEELRWNDNVFQMIVGCHGIQQPRVPLGLVSVLMSLIENGRMEIVEMPSGKNAADFGLTFWAGRLSLRYPNAEFLIASKDQDLDFAVGLLRKQGCRAKRIASTSAVRSMAAQDSWAKDETGRPHVITFCQRLHSVASPPRRREGLLNFATSGCPKRYDWLAALKVLENLGVITYGANNVVAYDQKRIAECAHQQPPKPVPDVTEKLPLKRILSKTRTSVKTKSDGVSDLESKQTGDDAESKGIDGNEAAEPITLRQPLLFD